MSKTKLVFLAMGNAVICAQSFLMIGMAMADSRIVLEPGIGTLVAALVLFITSGANMAAIYEMQQREARRREGAAGRAQAGVQIEPQATLPLAAERALLEGFAQEMAAVDRATTKGWRLRLPGPRARAKRAG